MLSKEISIKLISLFFLFHFHDFNSQDLLPPITNFKPNDYEAAAQNWDIDIDDKGYIYIANNQGLLNYNGLSWSTNRLPENNPIRSVHVKDSLIYTGAYNEFGFWKRNSKGELIYKSLKSKAKGFSLNEEIWQIISIDDMVYFRSFGKIYLFDGDEISILKEINSNTMISFKDELYVADVENGLFIINNEGAEESFDNHRLDDKRILDLDKHKDKLIIASKNKIFEYKNSKIKLLGDRNLWENLSRWELNKIEIVDNSTIVIGTVKNGIIIYNLDTNTFQSINRLKGLQNNTVLSLKEVKNQLWIGLDYGIDMVELKSPFKFLIENTGELGSVYDIEFFQNKTYIGSNTGVYSFNKGSLEIIKGTEGHTWNLDNLNDSLFINHNTGVYMYDDDELKNIDTNTGSFVIKKIDDKSGSLIGSYTGLKHLKDSITKLPDFGLPIKDFVIENESNLWVLTLYDGLFKINCDQRFTDVISYKKIKIPNGKIDSNTRITIIKNQLTVFNKGKWYKFNQFRNTLEDFKDFKFLENKKPIYSNGNMFWFLDTKHKGFYITNFKNFQVYLNSNQLENRLVKNYENVVHKMDSTYQITLKDGFSEVNLTNFEHYSENEGFQKPEVIGLRNKERRFDLNIERLPYEESRDLYFDVAYPSQNKRFSLKYRLRKNEILRDGYVKSGTLNFQNLYEGNYTVDFYIAETQLGEVNLDSFKFIISSPWYWSTHMKLTYIFVTFLSSYIVYIINKSRLKKHKEKLSENYKKQQLEELKKQEKQRLLNELDFKSKELVNTSLAIAKKNEILIELEKELKSDENPLKNQYNLKRIIGKINNALNNKNEWDVFELNFNEIHNEFFKKLLKSYPELSKSDLKLCAYLKMNMSSKEIAPLMRISIRGVEIHRYRLRKKLSLDTSQSLNKFLIHNF